MIELIDNEKIVSLRIILFENKVDFEYLNYNIILCEKKQNEWIMLNDLSLINTKDLYFDILYERELDVFFNDINRLLSGEIINFNFSPYDEKEFTISISSIQENENFSVCYNSNVTKKEITFTVNKFSLLQFQSNFLNDINKKIIN